MGKVYILMPRSEASQDHNHSLVLCLLFDLIMTSGGLMNSGNLVFGSVHMYTVLVYLTNMVYFSSPKGLILLTVSATWVSMMSLMSMTSRSCE